MRKIFVDGGVSFSSQIPAGWRLMSLDEATARRSELHREERSSSTVRLSDARVTFKAWERRAEDEFWTVKPIDGGNESTKDAGKTKDSTASNAEALVGGACWALVVKEDEGNVSAPLPQPPAKAPEQQRKRMMFVCVFLFVCAHAPILFVCLFVVLLARPLAGRLLVEVDDKKVCLTIL